MRYCQNCGSQIDDNTVVCPACGCQVRELRTEPEENSVYGVLAIVFGALGGLLGLIFGIIGLKTYKDERYRKQCKIGIGLFIGWIILAVIIITLSMIAWSTV